MITNVYDYRIPDREFNYVPGPPCKPDYVNHPPHYIQGRKYEPIDVIEDWELTFNTGNALKYISRAGRKDDMVEDLKKAVWYLNREIVRLEKEGYGDGERTLHCDDNEGW